MVGCQSAGQNVGFDFFGSSDPSIMLGCVAWGCLSGGLKVVTSSVTAVDCILSGKGLELGGTGVTIGDTAAQCVIKNCTIEAFANAIDMTTNSGSVFEGNRITSGAIVNANAATIASAAGITLEPLNHHNFFQLSGTTDIGTITASYAGHRVSFLCVSGLSFLDSGSNNVKNKAGVNLVVAAARAVTYVCDGTNWYEA
jgi:nitrous oxidase accessory protein NosD